MEAVREQVVRKAPTVDVLLVTVAIEQQLNTLVTEVLLATTLDDFSAAAFVVDFDVLTTATLATAVVDINGCDMFEVTVTEPTCGFEFDNFVLTDIRATTSRVLAEVILAVASVSFVMAINGTGFGVVTVLDEFIALLLCIITGFDKIVLVVTAVAKEEHVLIVTGTGLTLVLDTLAKSLFDEVSEAVLLVLVMPEIVFVVVSPAAMTFTTESLGLIFIEKFCTVFFTPVTSREVLDFVLMSLIAAMEGEHCGNFLLA